MSKVIRLNDSIINKLDVYRQKLIQRYGDDCSLIPDADNYLELLNSALIDADSYMDWILCDRDI